MLTNEDIKKIVSVVATKEDIERIETRLSTLEEAMRNLAVSIEKFVVAMDDIKQEYLIMARKTELHEKWIKQIADKLNVRLEY